VAVAGLDGTKKLSVECMSDLSHCASALVAVPADAAFAFLMDGEALGTWALGSFATKTVAPGVVRGVSLFDDQACCVKPVGDAAAGRIEYYVGATPEKLQPRILAQVVPGPVLGHAEGVCQVNLIAWRQQGMSDERWLRLVRCHEVEILLIQARLERPEQGL